MNHSQKLKTNEHFKGSERRLTGLVTQLLVDHSVTDEVTNSFIYIYVLYVIYLQACRNQDRINYRMLAGAINLSRSNSTDLSNVIADESVNRRFNADERVFGALQLSSEKLS